MRQRNILYGECMHNTSPNSDNKADCLSEIAHIIAVGDLEREIIS